MKNYKPFISHILKSASILGLFLIFKNTIKAFIKSWLLFGENNFESSLVLDFLVVVFIITGFVISIYKLKLNYRPTEIFYYVTLIFSFAYIYYRFYPGSWEYETFTLVAIPYLDFLVVSILFFPVFNGVRLVYKCYLDNVAESGLINKTKYFIEDNPTNVQDIDLFGYGNVADKIIPAILNYSYDKAFVIGIVGPWGNGKSSLFNLIRDRINLKLTGNEVIQIDFFPFRSHNNQDIISDFFNSLAVELGRFDASLNKEITGYMKTLLDTYSNSLISNSIELVFADNKTLNSQYRSLDSSIRKLGKKIIVYVDDLDRLSATEIIDVLKLLRTSANFHNVVFLVAMDKSYILNSLHDQNENRYYLFLDKFFNLEIYLPENPKDILAKYFLTSLKSTVAFSEVDLKEFELALKDERLQFNTCVSNVRDVKRVVNQLVWESNFGISDTHKVDLVNWVFLKLVFPKFYQTLIKRPNDFFDNSNGQYILALSPEGIKGQTEISYNRVGTTGFVEYERKNFELFYSDDKVDSKFNLFEFGISDISYQIFEGLMIGLFGRTYDVDFNCIQIESKFNKLARLRYGEFDLTDEEFNSLLDSNDSKIMNTKLKELLSLGKANQLIERIPKNDSSTEFVVPFRSEKHFSSYFEVSCSILANSINKGYGIDENKIENKIRDFVSLEVVKKYSFSKEFIQGMVKTHCLENSEISLNLRAYFLSFTKTNKFDVLNWHLSDGEIKEFAEDYLKNSLIDADTKSINSTVFSIYYHLKNLNLLDINELFKSHLMVDLEGNKLRDFISITTQVEGGVGELFKLREVIKDIFDSFEGYYSFIIKYQDPDNQDVKEYWELLELMKIVDFQFPIKYEFRTLNMVNPQWVSTGGETFPQEQSDLTQQIILEFSDGVALDKLKGDPKLQGLNAGIRVYVHEKRKFLFIHFKDKDKIGFVNEIFNSMESTLNPDYPDLKIEDDLGVAKFIVNDGDKEMFKLVSLIPNPFAPPHISNND